MSVPVHVYAACYPSPCHAVLSSFGHGGSRGGALMRSCLTRWAVGCAALVAASSAAHAQPPPVTPAPPPPVAPAPPRPVAPTPPPAAQTAPPANSAQARVFGRILSVDDAVAI